MNFKQWRKSIGASQGKLAELWGMTTRIIQYAEKREKQPKRFVALMNYAAIIFAKTKADAMKIAGELWKEERRKKDIDAK